MFDLDAMDEMEAGLRELWRYSEEAKELAASARRMSQMSAEHSFVLRKASERLRSHSIAARSGRVSVS